MATVISVLTDVSLKMTSPKHHTQTASALSSPLLSLWLWSVHPGLGTKPTAPLQVTGKAGRSHLRDVFLPRSLKPALLINNCGGQVACQRSLCLNPKQQGFSKPNHGVGVQRSSAGWILLAAYLTAWFTSHFPSQPSRKLRTPLQPTMLTSLHLQAQPPSILGLALPCPALLTPHISLQLSLRVTLSALISA